MVIPQISPFFTLFRLSPFLLAWVWIISKLPYATASFCSPQLIISSHQYAYQYDIFSYYTINQLPDEFVSSTAFTFGFWYQQTSWNGKYTIFRLTLDDVADANSRDSKRLYLMTQSGNLVFQAYKDAAMTLLTQTNPLSNSWMFVLLSVDYTENKVTYYNTVVNSNDNFYPSSNVFDTSLSWDLNTDVKLYIAGDIFWGPLPEFTISTLLLYAGAFVSNKMDIRLYYQNAAPSTPQLWFVFDLRYKNTVSDEIIGIQRAVGTASTAPIWDWWNSAIDFISHKGSISFTPILAGSSPSFVWTASFLVSYIAQTPPGSCALLVVFSRISSGGGTVRWQIGFKGHDIMMTYQGTTKAIATNVVGYSSDFMKIDISCSLMSLASQGPPILIRINDVTVKYALATGFPTANIGYSEATNDNFRIGDPTCSFKGKLRYLKLWQNSGIDTEGLCMTDCIATVGQYSTKHCVSPTCLNYEHHFENMSCIQCDIKCDLCMGDMENDCLTCSNRSHFAYRPDNTLLSCVEECPYKFAPLTNSTCVPCHSSCETCWGPDTTNCATCYRPYFLYDGNYSCVLCRQNGFYRNRNECIILPAQDSTTIVNAISFENTANLVSTILLWFGFGRGAGGLGTMSSVFAGEYLQGYKLINQTHPDNIIAYYTDSSIIPIKLSIPFGIHQNLGAYDNDTVNISNPYALFPQYDFNPLTQPYVTDEVVTLGILFGISGFFFLMKFMKKFISVKIRKCFEVIDKICFNLGSVLALSYSNRFVLFGLLTLRYANKTTASGNTSSMLAYISLGVFALTFLGVSVVTLSEQPIQEVQKGKKKPQAKSKPFTRVSFWYNDQQLTYMIQKGLPSLILLRSAVIAGALAYMDGAYQSQMLIVFALNATFFAYLLLFWPYKNKLEAFLVLGIEGSVVAFSFITLRMEWYRIATVKGEEAAYAMGWWLLTVAKILKMFQILLGVLYVLLLIYDIYKALKACSSNEKQPVSISPGDEQSPPLKQTEDITNQTTILPK